MKENEALRARNLYLEAKDLGIIDQGHGRDSSRRAISSSGHEQSQFDATDVAYDYGELDGERDEDVSTDLDRRGFISEGKLYHSCR